MDSFIEDWFESIISFILFVCNYYYEEIGLDEMVDVVYLFCYYFSWLFK